jgi:hypothetical protein
MFLSRRRAKLLSASSSVLLTGPFDDSLDGLAEGLADGLADGSADAGSVSDTLWMSFGRVSKELLTTSESIWTALL